MLSSGYYRFPDVHQNVVVFVSEDDLWQVPLSGGIAQRLTANLAAVASPKISPDGQWVAYAALEEGYREVYVMPLPSGPQRRLTFLGCWSTPLAWREDSQAIYFSSNFETPFFGDNSIYQVPLSGGEPILVPVGHANQISFGQQKNSCVIGRHTRDTARWKRYRGGRTGELWIDIQGNGQFNKLLNLPANLTDPTWIGKRIYFISDHEGIGNIYSCNLQGEDMVRHSHHEEFYARNASSDGHTIVYHAGADLYAVDVTANSSRKIQIQYNSSQTQTNRKWIKGNRYIYSYDISPSGTHTALVIRNKLVSFAHWSGAVTQSGQRDGVQYRLATWLYDSKTLVAVSDEHLGEDRLLIINTENNTSRLLKNVPLGIVHGIFPSPKDHRVVITNHRNEMILVDWQQETSRVMDVSIFARIGRVSWSNDARWLAYDFAIRNDTTIIRLCEISTGKCTPITPALLQDFDPVFSPDGKYLFFVGHRVFNPVYDSLQFDLGFVKSTKLYAVMLAKDTPSPFIPQAKSPAGEDKKEKDERQKSEDKKKATKQRTAKKAAQNQAESQTQAPTQTPTPTNASSIVNAGATLSTNVLPSTTATTSNLTSSLGTTGGPTPSTTTSPGTASATTVGAAGQSTQPATTAGQTTPPMTAAPSPSATGQTNTPSPQPPTNGANAAIPASTTMPVSTTMPTSSLSESQTTNAADKQPVKPETEPKGKHAKDEKIVEIDLDGITQRIVAFPIETSIYFSLAVYQNKVLYLEHPRTCNQPDENTWYNHEPKAQEILKAYDLEKLSEETLIKGITSFTMSLKGSTILVRQGNQLFAYKTGDKPKEKLGQRYTSEDGEIDLNRISLMIQPKKEWEQMYRQAWILQREHFWTPDMSGVDWELVYRRYLPLLERVGSRGEFSDLIWEMQGELGTSHCYELGGDYRPGPRYLLGSLGCSYCLSKDSHDYIIENVLYGDSTKESERSPLCAPGINIQEGDHLLAIGGIPVNGEVRPRELLISLAGQEVALTIRRASERKPHTVVVKTLKNEEELRYRSWVERNREYVHEKSQGKLGYVHIPDMGVHGFAEFHRYYLAECGYQGLVVDVRFNGGGHVSQLLLEKLCRKPIGYRKPRWTKIPYSYPHHAVAGPMIAITNQYAGSDGDIFSHAFKLLKLGKLIGKRTWGGVIGINGQYSLADGTVTTQPEYSCWFSDVGWGVENYGTDPDIDVEISPQDYMAKRDTQLDKAIELLLEELNQHPVAIPELPQPPSRALPKLPKL